MDRRAFITLMGWSIVIGPLAAEAQTAGKVYRVGVLWNLAPNTAASQRNSEAFEQGLRERGWVEGQNVVLTEPTARMSFRDRLTDLPFEP